MADKKIFIHISSDSEGGSVTANKSITTGNATANKKTKEAGEKEEDNQIVTTLLINEAKKVMSTALSQFQNITGDAVTAKKLGRKFIGIEKEKEYVSLALKRLELADSNPDIQGYENGIFKLRNGA